MRKLKKPNHRVSFVFDVCVSIAPNGQVSNNCKTAKNAIVQAESEYEAMAVTSDLHLINRNQASVRKASKEDLAKLYTRLRDNKNARYLYDEIRANAAPGKCPYCSSGTIGTLDHYLPKTSYPLFTITPANLVPSCERCNGKKKDSTPKSRGEQPLHPYFDDFSDERWLFAKLNCLIPVSARFFVKAPPKWPEEKQKRIESHFADLDLETVFISDAAQELSGMMYELREILDKGGPDYLTDHLKRRAASHLASHPNSWQTALYFACAESDWFCDGKFLND